VVFLFGGIKAEDLNERAGTARAWRTTAAGGRGRECAKGKNKESQAGAAAFTPETTMFLTGAVSPVSLNI
jgi:hypothetical protein